MPAILVVRLARNIEMLYMISYTSFLRGNNSLCLLVSEIFFISANQKQKLSLETMSLLSNRDEMRNSYR